jgi:ATP-dependent helicase/nuclease subunit B
MIDFLAPQLPLEALMLKAGAFEALAPAEVSALTYIKIGLGPEAFNLHPFRVREGAGVVETAEEMSRRLKRHVDALLLEDALPMAARVFPKPDPQRRYRGDYDHLGRNDEWRVNEGDESE